MWSVVVVEACPAHLLASYMLAPAFSHRATAVCLMACGVGGGTRPARSTAGRHTLRRQWAVVQKLPERVGQAGAAGWRPAMSRSSWAASVGGTGTTRPSPARDFTGP